MEEGMNRNERIQHELVMLRSRFPGLHVHGDWACIPGFALPGGWAPSPINVVFHIDPGYPGKAPYGIYVPVGLRHNGEKPLRYNEPAKNKPPFDGQWAVLSWAPEDGQWQPKDNISEGSNLMNWALSFSERFRGGR